MFLIPSHQNGRTSNRGREKIRSLTIISPKMPPLTPLWGYHIVILLIKSNLSPRHNANTKKHFQLFIYLGRRYIFFRGALPWALKTREFQYKFLNRIIYTSKALHKMGMKSHLPLAPFVASHKNLSSIYLFWRTTQHFLVSKTCFGIPDAILSWRKKLQQSYLYAI